MLMIVDNYSYYYQVIIIIVMIMFILFCVLLNTVRFVFIMM